MTNNYFENKMQIKDSGKKIDVTLGICVRNDENTIKQAIESMLNQTFDKKHMELIVVNDGSSDGTLSIITEVLSKEKKIKVKLFSTSGKGVSEARQIIVDNTSGKYLIFVDGDMVLPKGFVQKQVDAIDQNPLLGVVGGKMKGGFSKSITARLESISQSQEYEFGMLKEWRRNPKKVGTGGSIFRTSAIRRVGGFDLRIKGAGEDSDLSVRIKSSGYLLFQSQAEFEHEFKQTWNSLWRQYAWYGYGSHYCYHKNKDLRDLVYTYFFPLSIGGGIVRSILCFKSTRQKISFLLPFFNLFKATAWWFGFFKANRECYEPDIHA